MNWREREQYQQCQNPACDRIVHRNVLYCCSCCQMADAEKYVPEHGASCNERHLEHIEMFGGDEHYHLRVKSQARLDKVKAPPFIPIANTDQALVFPKSDAEQISKD